MDSGIMKVEDTQDLFLYWILVYEFACHLLSKTKSGISFLDS